MKDLRIPVHRPELIWQTVDNELVIVSPAQGKVRALNELGATVWQMIDGEQTINQICINLSAAYTDTPIDQIEADLQEFITDLDSRNLITWQS